MTSGFEFHPAGEVQVGSSDLLAQLTSMLDPGIHRLAGNEDLETAYLRYQASVLDEIYAGAPNYFRIDQLPDHEREQAAGLIGRIASMTSCPPHILAERLQRIRVLAVETHAPRQKQVGGEFINGLVVVASEVNARPRSPQERNHALIHEIAHGLTIDREVAVFDQSVNDFGGGLASRRILPRDGQAARSLVLANEALVDTTVLGVSDINPKIYLRGGHPSVGYWQEDNVLAKLTAEQPELGQAMLHAAFVSGVDTMSEAQTFADAYATQANSMAQA